MLGKIIRIERVTREIKNGDNKGKKVNHVITTCDVVFNDNNEIKRLKWDVTEDYFKKYIDFCGFKSSKQCIGETVSVVIARRTYNDTEGKERAYTFIKFLNFLDDGELIIMPKEENTLPF